MTRLAARPHLSASSHERRDQRGREESAAAEQPRPSEARGGDAGDATPRRAPLFETRVMSETHTAVLNNPNGSKERRLPAMLGRAPLLKPTNIAGRATQKRSGRLSSG
jgi:hypothetical protein